MTYFTKNAEETKNIARELASTLKGGETIALLGDLGSGKTTFVQGLAAALGSTARVTSPTFTVMHEYPCDKGVIRRIVHIDLYRFTDEKDLRALALDDERRDDTIIVIEWPNVIAFDFSPDVTVTFAHGEGENEREIKITSTAPSL